MHMRAPLPQRHAHPRVQQVPPAPARRRDTLHVRDAAVERALGDAEAVPSTAVQSATWRASRRNIGRTLQRVHMLVVWVHVRNIY